MAVTELKFAIRFSREHSLDEVYHKVADGNAGTITDVKTEGQICTVRWDHILSEHQYRTGRFGKFELYVCEQPQRKSNTLSPARADTHQSDERRRYKGRKSESEEDEISTSTERKPTLTGSSSHSPHTSSGSNLSSTASGMDGFSGRLSNPPHVDAGHHNVGPSNRNFDVGGGMESMQSLTSEDGHQRWRPAPAPAPDSAYDD
eukprot:1441484-Rhodomonas_salina.3